MDHRYPGIDSPSSEPKPYSTASSEMTVLMSRPWAVTRNLGHFRDWEMYLPRDDAQSKRLPPIKEVFPGLGLGSRDDDNFGSFPKVSRVTSPNFDASPNKRRRYEDEAEAEAAQRGHVPRVHRYPRHRVPVSPCQSPSAPRSSERWNPAPETIVSPGSSYSVPTPMSLPLSAPMEAQDLSRPRMALPSLRTSMNFENEPPNSLDSSLGGPRDYPWVYSHEYTYYNTHSHNQSQPSSPGRPYDGAAFSGSGSVYPHHVEPSRTSQSQGQGQGQSQSQSQRHLQQLAAMAAGSALRKRRGNLPKETTDRLRRWFAAHLSHPYPTEDEKQDLVRRTGLQLNQISNWFINARRRQLPGLLKRQRENEAARRGLASREGESTDPSSTASSPRSEAGAHSSDEVLQRRRSRSIKRGSV